jgi:hypothetical protein
MFVVVILMDLHIFSSPHYERTVFGMPSLLLRRVFGPRRDEVMGGWRKLHNEELRDLYSSPSIIRIIKSRRMTWAGHGLGRPRHRWVNNVWMDVGEVGWGDVDWIGLAQNRDKWRALVNTILNLQVP